MASEKLFLDTVHGYISVPEDYCNKLIDTPHFQRLRRIEQSSARSLFPCARHDRFVHSLGVFHIGRRILNSICRDKNISSDINDGIKQSFLIACLLHDCGHSPFSHTLEDRFGEKKDLFEVYKSALQDRDIDIPEEWKNDFIPNDTKQHEIISAYLCVTVFGDSIYTLGGDVGLIGRMIMGLQYKEDGHSLENCFISLLNGAIIDADKLDYVCRDQWALGYCSNAVDVDRLIEGIGIHNHEGQFQVVFKKNSITEIQAVVDSKNFQLVNVFHHHQVEYDQYLLNTCVDELEKTVGDNIFNYKAIEDSVEVGGIKLKLLADDDVMHLMKTKLGEESHLDEWLSREYKYVSLWKSRAEFIALFREAGGAKILSDGDGSIFVDKIIAAIKKVFDDDIIERKQNIKLIFVAEEKILVDFGQGHIVDFYELNLPFRKDVYKDEVFSYVFVPKDKKNKHFDDVINEIKSVLNSK